MRKKNIFRTCIFLVCIVITYSIKAQNHDSTTVKKYLRQAVNSLHEDNYKQTRENSLNALKIDPNCGDAYILIGMAYAESVTICSESRFAKGMVFCLAVDMFENAIKVDRSVIEKATKLINVYSNYFPSREGLPFIEPHEGDKYKIECWINEETTIRFSD